MSNAVSFQEFDVSASFALLANGEDGLCLKIASPQIEVNVWLLPHEAAELSHLPSRSEVSKSLRLGLSAGEGVHWSRDAHGFYHLLVGEDDETWDIALTLDRVTFAAILNAVAHPNR